MGIWGLKWYDEQRLRTGKKASILGLARQYRAKFQKRPVLLIDGSNFLYSTCAKVCSPELIGGGEIKKVTDTIVKFLLKLRENEIDFVIFFDENTRADRLAICKRRSYERFKSVNELFDLMEQGLPVTPFVCSIEGLSFYFTNYLTSLGIKYVSTIQEADDEIMDYISKHGCFGVMSNDTDFMVSEGIPYVFKITDLDFHHLTAEYTNSSKLALALGLRPILLPYFATLCGNDVITRPDLRNFHLFLISNHPNFERIATFNSLPADILFPEVVGWLKKHFGDTPTLKEDAPELLAKFLSLSHLAPDFKRSVNSYVLKSPSLPKPSEKDSSQSRALKLWNRLLDLALEKIQLGLLHFKIYDIMANLIYSISCSMQKYDTPGFTCAPVVLKKVSARLYGLLLSERPAELGPAVVDGWIFTGANSLDAAVRVYPEFPGNKYDLATYWSSSCPNSVKWEIFCWIIDPTLDPKEVMQLPRLLCVPTLAVYLINGAARRKQDSWAIEALLVQAALLLTASLSDVNSARTGEQTPVCIHYSTVYRLICRELYIASQACGSPVAIHHHPSVPFFDMKTYNETCLKIKSHSTGQRIIEKLNNPQATEGYQKMMEFLEWHGPV